MACFVAPMTAAIVTTAVQKKVPAKYHINWLNSMLWGGVLALIVEHISHREIVIYPPFFTAGLSEMLPEIVKVGVPMTGVIFLVWMVMVAISLKIKKLKYASI
ncbi:MAG: hypothetical protein NC925_01615 [Candidatus Omnitrophica bacterium]|nr:hypothetical protein [Candidatus Omnitrophota bacterium]MCM8831544.1 hypothetical protein [Candidatus Omnitrophota bacterium]